MRVKFTVAILLALIRLAIAQPQYFLAPGSVVVVAETVAVEPLYRVADFAFPCLLTT